MEFRFFRLLVEQPKGSAMFTLPEMEKLIASKQMKRHLTYMGYWATWQDSPDILSRCNAELHYINLY